MSIPIHALSKPAYSHLTEFHGIAPSSERAQQQRAATATGEDYYQHRSGYGS